MASKTLFCIRIERGNDMFEICECRQKMIRNISKDDKHDDILKHRETLTFTRKNVAINMANKGTGKKAGGRVTKDRVEIMVEYDQMTSMAGLTGLIIPTGRSLTFRLRQSDEPLHFGVAMKLHQITTGGGKEAESSELASAPIVTKRASKALGRNAFMNEIADLFKSNASLKHMEPVKKTENKEDVHTWMTEIPKSPLTLRIRVKKDASPNHVRLIFSIVKQGQKKGKKAQKGQPKKDTPQKKASPLAGVENKKLVSNMVGIIFSNKALTPDTEKALREHVKEYISRQPDPKLRGEQKKKLVKKLLGSKDKKEKNLDEAQITAIVNKYGGKNKGNKGKKGKGKGKGPANKPASGKAEREEIANDQPSEKQNDQESNIVYF